MNNYKFTFKCNCGNEFHITLLNMVNTDVIFCPNCKLNVDKDSTSNLSTLIATAKAILKFEELKFVDGQEYISGRYNTNYKHFDVSIEKNDLKQ